MTSVEERFNAAVNVIKNLPKNGPYQPSHTMMLKFYSYYKQATLGRCTQKKPPFWDIVGNTKWNAWFELGDMTKELAMELYVEELRKIIEFMSFNENVANFMGSVAELDCINLDDLEAVAPGISKLAQSHPSSPFGSRCNSPQPGITVNGNTKLNGHAVNSSEDYSDNFVVSKTSNPLLDQSDDEYTDTVEVPSELADDTLLENHSNYRTAEMNDHVVDQIQTMVQRMSTEFSAINQRLNIVEKNLSEVTFVLKKILSQRKSKWWPFKDISPQWFLLLVIWPFLAFRFIRIMQSK